MSGPARKPAEFRVIAGTERECRPPAEAQIELPKLASVPQPPDWLKNAHALAEWSRLAPMLHRAGLLTEGGVSAFAVLCAVHGTIVDTYSKGESPTANTIAQYRSLVNDFGLTPGAQTRVKAPGQHAPVNRFAKFGKRPG